MHDTAHIGGCLGHHLLEETTLHVLRNIVDTIHGPQGPIISPVEPKWLELSLCRT